MYGYFYKFFIQVYRTRLTYRAYTMQLEETWLICHYKFISAKNIIIIFVSSDDTTCLICGRKTTNMDYNLDMGMKKKERKKTYTFK